MTGTRVDVNRNGTPDVLQQPQFGLAPQGVHTPVLHGAPVNMDTMTVTDNDMNRNNTPDNNRSLVLHLRFCYSCAAWSPSEHGHHDRDRC